MHYLYIDYGYATERLIEESEDLAYLEQQADLEAMDDPEQEQKIEVLSFSDDGEVQTDYMPD